MAGLPPAIRVIQDSLRGALSGGKPCAAFFGVQNSQAGDCSLAVCGAPGMGEV